MFLLASGAWTLEQLKKSSGAIQSLNGKARKVTTGLLCFFSPENRLKMDTSQTSVTLTNMEVYGTAGCCSGCCCTLQAYKMNIGVLGYSMRLIGVQKDTSSSRQYRAARSSFYRGAENSEMKITRSKPPRHDQPFHSRVPGRAGKLDPGIVVWNGGVRVNTRPGVEKTFFVDEAAAL